MIVPFILGGAGMALVFAPAASAVLASVRTDQTGQASGATNAIRELGGVLGIAVLSTIFSAPRQLRVGTGVRQRAEADDVGRSGGPAGRRAWSRSWSVSTRGQQSAMPCTPRLGDGSGPGFRPHRGVGSRRGEHLKPVEAARPGG